MRDEENHTYLIPVIDPGGGHMGGKPSTRSGKSRKFAFHSRRMLRRRRYREVQPADGEVVSSGRIMMACQGVRLTRGKV